MPWCWARIFLNSILGKWIKKRNKSDFQLLHDVVLMAIAVFFLFMMMSKLLFNPVRKMLADRREKIAGELSDAANDKKDAAALKADYEARLKNIVKEAEQI